MRQYRVDRIARILRTDRELLRDGDQRYQGHLFDQMYQDWVTKGLSPTEVNALINPSPERQKMAFQVDDCGNARRIIGPR